MTANYIYCCEVFAIGKDTKYLKLTNEETEQLNSPFLVENNSFLAVK